MTSSSLRLELIKQMPEMVLRTIDHGVVHHCRRCGGELDRDSPAVLGYTITRNWLQDPFNVSSENYPRCKQCSYTHPDLAVTMNKACISVSKLLFLPPIPHKSYRKYEHVIEVKKSWFGKEKIVDSVIELADFDESDATNHSKT